MPTNYGILYDKDRRVRVYNAGTPVVASNLQSVYAKYLNFIGNRFTTAANGDKYDISLTYPDKVIPYEGGTAQGSVPGFLDFNDTHFDVSALTGDKYIITNPAYGKAFANNFTTTPRKLNFVGATVTEDVPNDEYDITVTDTKAAVFNNNTQVGTIGRRLNFLGTGHSIVEDTPNDQFDIDLAYLTPPYAKKWGTVQGGQVDFEIPFGDGLFNLKYNYTDGNVSGGISNTHGHFRRYELGGEDNNLIGLETDFPMTQLAFNPHIYGKISMAVLDDSRFFLGWNSEDILTGENTYLDDLSGYGLGYQYDTAETEDTVWYNILNDGDAAENKIATAINLSDTTPFTFELVGDNANNRWGFNINGGAFTYRNKGTAEDTPDTNTNLRFTFRMEEIGSDPMTLDVYYLYWTQDR